MTEVTIFQNQDQGFLGFTCVGHAGFARHGRDVVCAGISILVENTVNAIEAYTDDGFFCEADQASGDISFRLEEPAGHDADLLLRAMVLGLEGIQSSYGKKFLKVTYREV